MRNWCTVVYLLSISNLKIEIPANASFVIGYIYIYILVNRRNEYFFFSSIHVEQVALDICTYMRVSIFNLDSWNEHCKIYYLDKWKFYIYLYILSISIVEDSQMEISKDLLFIGEWKFGARIASNQ